MTTQMDFAAYFLIVPIWTPKDVSSAWAVTNLHLINSGLQIDNSRQAKLRVIPCSVMSKVSVWELSNIRQPLKPISIAR